MILFFLLPFLFFFFLFFSCFSSSRPPFIVTVTMGELLSHNHVTTKIMLPPPLCPRSLPLPSPSIFIVSSHLSPFNIQKESIKLGKKVVTHRWKYSLVIKITNYRHNWPMNALLMKLSICDTSFNLLIHLIIKFYQFCY